MTKIELDINFKSGKDIEDLIRILNEMSQSTFIVTQEKKRDMRTKEGKEVAWFIWRHKQSNYGGKIRLGLEWGVSSINIDDESDGRLTGAFISWIIRNATNTVRSIYLKID